MGNTTKPTSLRLTEARLTNLERIAKALGCERGGRGSIGVLLNKIADADLVVSKNGMQTPPIPSFVVQQAIQQATPIPVQPPAWNAPMCQKSEFVTDRGDGTFVDTEEFDKPVPQKRVPVTEPTEASVVKPISISVGMSKEEKRAMFEQLKGLGSAIKKGSEL